MKANVTLVLGSDTPQEFINWLDNIHIPYIKVEPISEVNKTVCGHTDIMLFPVNERRFVCAPNISRNVICKLVSAGAEAVMGSKPLGRNYPEDIAYNVAKVGNKAFHNTKYTDTVLKDELKKLGISLIHVNQGYTKCSVCVVSEDAIITQDAGVAKVTAEYGIDTLLIERGNIKLKDTYDGFIGGATGLLDTNTLVFCGDPTNHPEFERIQKFCKKHGVKTMPIGNNITTDIGSVFTIKRS